MIATGAGMGAGLDPRRRLRVRRVLASAGAAPLGATEIEMGRDGRIAALRPIDPATLTPEEARLIVMPGLCDAHDHGRGIPTLAIGAPDQPLETWLPDLTRQPRIDPYLNAAVAFARLAQSGVCAVNHCHNTQDGGALLAEAEAVSRAARDVGIAVAFAWPFFDRNAIVYGDLDPLLARLPPAQAAGLATGRDRFRSCAQNMALLERATAFEHPLFRLQYHPVAPQWVQHETLAAIADASARTGRRIHTHLLETERQRDYADAQYPDGLLPFLDRIGFLSPRLTVAHAVWLRPDECALLAARGVTVSLNQSSNLRLRSGTPPVADLLAAGTAIALGLDGMSLDDDSDMLRELRLAGLVHARASEDRRALDPVEVLAAAWLTGRRTILGDDGGGTIAVGAPADLLALDFAALSHDCLMPEPDPVALLLGRAQARHVVRLIVGGRDVVVDGRCVTVDLPAREAALTAQARAAYALAAPDDAAITALRAGVASYYRDGCHVQAHGG